jgi:inner membrane protein YidH
LPAPSDNDERTSETADALRRTRLASERTYLAWWRTGLTAIAVGIATGGIAAKLVGQLHWAYIGIGAGFTALGVVLLGYALRRQITVDRAVSEGNFAPLDTRVLMVLTIGGATLGVLTIVLLLWSL